LARIPFISGVEKSTPGQEMGSDNERLMFPSLLASSMVEAIEETFKNKSKYNKFQF
jgi:hypothetical protein